MMLRLAVLAVGLWCAWKLTERLRASHDDLDPAVVGRIFRERDAKQRVRDLTEMRKGIDRTTKYDGSPVTKAHSRVGVGR